jgi:hypothetical protein
MAISAVLLVTVPSDSDGTCQGDDAGPEPPARSPQAISTQR